MFQLGEVQYYKVALFFFSDTPAVSTPRRSPRLVRSRFDSFVHKLEGGNRKRSNTAEVIHNVDIHAKLSKTIDNIIDPLYVPREGIYWLRKGNKQPVLLKSDKIWKHARRKYGTGSIRIA